MRALTVLPGTPNSARLDDVADPPAAEGAILVRTLALGVCGTDREIVAGQYGAAPPGEQRLILGHESLGRVESAPPDSGFRPGDLLVGIVRRPDPVPCGACAVGEWDMCRNGRYTERGIKERHGYCAEHFRIEPDFAVKVDAGLGTLAVLMEPTSIVAKGWDHIDRIGRRTRSWEPRTVAVTGAGPVGQLAALLGKQHGLSVHVFDRNRDGVKPALVEELGGTYHSDMAELDALKPDIVLECTGSTAVVQEVFGRSGPSGIVCLASVTAPGRKSDIDLGQLNRTMVLENDTIFGTVNANRAHYEMAAEALGRADRDWLGKLITRRVPLDHWAEALDRRPNDIKVVIDFAL